MLVREDVLASLHDQVFAWERMLRGASSILETIIDHGMMASPSDDMRASAHRAYEMLDFTSAQIALFIRQQDLAGAPPSELIQDLTRVLSDSRSDPN
jgi:signal recognition particle receptor subunit beta